MFELFLDFILSTAKDINDLLWGPGTLIFIALVMVYFTIRSGFFQMRKFPYIMKNTFGRMFEKGDTESGRRITPFQAATTSLAGTVGMGNIAGVAVAIGIGGPGAIFWMWLLAILGMTLKTAEITLAVHYREVDKEGNLFGGPMFYIRKGLGWKPLAVAFSVGMILDALLSATLLQPHTVGRAFLKSYNVNPYLVAFLMAVVTGLVVIGGLRRIGQFCEKLVPLMSLVYILAGLTIVAVNIGKIPQVILDIFKYAFTPAPAFGGLAGASIIAISAGIREGVSKGMFSNEAGQGSAPMAHAAAVTKHPFQQGIWGAFEVFVDTIIICTITAFVVLSTGKLSGGEKGIDLVISAFGTVFSEGVAGILVAFSILTFCLTTQIGFFVYYETSVVDIFGKKPMVFLKWFYLIPGIIFAGVANVDDIWVLAGITVAVCSIPNMIAVLFLNNAFFKLMKDFLSGENRYATDKVDGKENLVKIPGKK